MAFTFILGPSQFQQLAQADTLYQNLSTTGWGQTDRTIDYTYDTNGSLLSKTTKETSTSTVQERLDYQYNYQGRLRRLITDLDSASGTNPVDVVDYTYNDSGIRVSAYYNPSNGRFNRVDPYAGNMQDPQSLHKYLYCHVNPVNNIDSSGLMSTTFELNVGMLIMGVLVTMMAVDMIKTLKGDLSLGLGLIKLTEAIFTGFIDLSLYFGDKVLEAAISVYYSITAVISAIHTKLPKIKKLWNSGDYDLCVQTFTPPFDTPAKYISFGRFPLSIQVGGKANHIAGICLSNKITRNPWHEFTLFRLDYHPYPKVTTSLFVLHWHSEFWPGHHEILRWPLGSK